MGSNNYGEPNMGGGGGGGSSSSGSSRKGKKSNSDNKAKQPQRGLGVAQLEKIRLHGQVGPFLNTYPTSGFITNNLEETRVQAAAAAYASTFASTQSSSSPAGSYGFHPNIMMGHGEYDQRASMVYGDHSSLPSNAMLEPTQQYIQPGLAARHQLLSPQEGFPQTRGKKHRSNSVGSIGQNSETSDSQEVDLELRLSL